MSVARTLTPEIDAMHQTMTPAVAPGHGPLHALVAHVVTTARTRTSERRWRAAYAIHERLVAMWREALAADDMPRLAQVGRAMDVAWGLALEAALAGGGK